MEEWRRGIYRMECDEEDMYEGRQWMRSGRGWGCRKDQLGVAAMPQKLPKQLLDLQPSCALGRPHARYQNCWSM